MYVYMCVYVCVCVCGRVYIYFMYKLRAKKLSYIQLKTVRKYLLNKLNLYIMYSDA